MLTSKQRAYLRSEASKTEPLFQIGKESLNAGVVAAADSALSARELIKLTVLRTAGETPKTLLAALADALKAEPVCAIGEKIVLYRRSKRRDVKHIALPEGK